MQPKEQEETVLDLDRRPWPTLPGGGQAVATLQGNGSFRLALVIHHQDQPSLVAVGALAGLLHDIGKIGIRDAVLSKTEPLTAEEFEHTKQHVIVGYSIRHNLKPILHLLPGVRNHHERFDGTGYPDGLAGRPFRSWPAFSRWRTAMTP